MARILGIDPGLIKTGWGVIDYAGGALRFVACGLIKTDSSLSLAPRLASLSNGIRVVIEQYAPDQCAIEETFVNKNPMSSLKLGHARGALMLSVMLTGMENLAEYPATLIKKSITGVGRAEKNQVCMMIKQIMPNAKINSEDESDALAVAVCHSSHAIMRKIALQNS